VTEEKNEALVKEGFKEQEKKRQEKEQAKYDNTKRIPNEQNRMIDTQKR
jgi:hypothetical protein